MHATILISYSNILRLPFGYGGTLLTFVFRLKSPVGTEISVNWRGARFRWIWCVTHCQNHPKPFNLCWVINVCVWSDISPRKIIIPLEFHKIANLSFVAGWKPFRFECSLRQILIHFKLKRYQLFVTFFTVQSIRKISITDTKRHQVLTFPLVSE